LYQDGNTCQQIVDDVERVVEGETFKWTRFITDQLTYLTLEPKFEKGR
jgi:hypothetical protein